MLKMIVGDVTHGWECFMFAWFLMMLQDCLLRFLGVIMMPSKQPAVSKALFHGQPRVLFCGAVVVKKQRVMAGDGSTIKTIKCYWKDCWSLCCSQGVSILWRTTRELLSVQGFGSCLNLAFFDTPVRIRTVPVCGIGCCSLTCLFEGLAVSI